MHDDILILEKKKRIAMSDFFFIKHMYISSIIDCTYIDIQRDCLKSSIDNSIIC
jgi:hypothetical protein